MKTFRNGDTEWTFDDDSLEGVVRSIVPDEGGRRGHSVVDWGGKKLFIKSFKEKGLAGFIRNRITPRGKKEYQAARILLSCGIDTPASLGYGVSGTGSYVIQEYMEGENLTSALEKPEKRAGLFLKLAGLLRTLSTHRIRHNDLHLENILLCGDRLVLVDLHSMNQKNAFSRDDEVSNLTHALAMVYRGMTMEEEKAFFQAYGVSGLREVFETALRTFSRRWVESKKKRAFQQTSLTVSRNGRLYMAGMEAQGQGTFLENIKEDRKVRVDRFTDHVRKIYRNKRRLTKAWKAHVVLAYMQLPLVPQAYYVELPSSLRKGFIAMEDVKGRGLEFDRYLDGRYDGMASGERKCLAEGLGEFFLEMLNMRVFHRDLKACNIMALHTGAFLLLDVEDIEFRDMEREDFVRIFTQLNTTVPRRIALKERLRFFVKFKPLMAGQARPVLRMVRKESLKQKIVYEGVSGLREESW